MNGENPEKLIIIVGIDVGSETHYARAFDWRNYEYSKKPYAFISWRRSTDIVSGITIMIL